MDAKIIVTCWQQWSIAFHLQSTLRRKIPIVTRMYKVRKRRYADGTHENKLAHQKQILFRDN